MFKPPFAMPYFAVSSIAGIAVVACLIPSALVGQTPPSAASTAQADPNAAFLAKAKSLYYSTTKAGLTGFDCSVRPDWANIFKIIEKSSAATAGDQAADEKHVALLKAVKITLHARLTGPGSGLDWKPDTTALPDQESLELLDHMHQATGQNLQGFLQFWTPLVNGSVIPDSSAGIEVTKTATGHTIHAMDGSTSLTEVLDAGNVLKQFKVEMTGAKISFEPGYTATPNGLLVSSFAARIQAPGATPAQEQKMNVKVEYQTVKGLLIPHTLSMEQVGSGVVAFTFEGCTVNP
jgi:hypothetical protein